MGSRRLTIFESLLKTTTVMKTMDRIDFREIANAKISSRLKQVFILAMAIVLGMILSVGVNV